MTQRPDPLDLLAFIESGMSMTSEQIAERWPEWHARRSAATARYLREAKGSGNPYGEGRARSDPMVDSLSAAWHHWVNLPLIRAVLSDSGSRTEP